MEVQSREGCSASNSTATCRLGTGGSSKNYNEGDEICIFGFSRGAFTARGLARLIARCGVLNPKRSDGLLGCVRSLIRKPMPCGLFTSCRTTRIATARHLMTKSLLNNTWYEPRLVKMDGVGDTVGYLGVPLGRSPGISSAPLRSHNARLSTIVERSYQALALDEHRRQYWGIL